MLVYNYDLKTKEFLYSCLAELDPEETKKQGKNVYLIPANATTKKPPKCGVHETAVYNDGWTKTPDFRNEYIVDSEMKPYVYKELGSLPEGYICITEAQAETIKEDDLYYVISGNDLIINPNYEEDKQAREDEEFNRQFFPTTLGYVRRQVTMKDGSHQNFLTDILPLLVVGVPVLVYSRELVQTRVQVTEVFINECKQQLFKDFYGAE